MVKSDCEESLRNLGIDCIDLFQLHWPAPEAIEETAAACAELFEEGKIRAIGVSNFSVEQLTAWKATGVPLHTVQNAYSLFRRSDEDIVLPWCADNDVAYLAYSPMHRGLLFGGWAMNKTFAADDHRAQRPDFTQPRLGVLVKAVEAMKHLAAEHDLSMPELATGALLSREGCTAVIIGARNAEQGKALGALGMPLKANILDALGEILTQTDEQLANL
jgi:aryl-alcohol dehydrogenase-like predicted oxidoreductase